MRLLAALSELSIDELRLVELFTEWLARDKGGQGIQEPGEAR